jgi:transposase-like protein
MNDKQLPNRARVKMFWDLGYDSYQIARIMKNSEANVYRAITKILDERYTAERIYDQNYSRASAQC